MDAMPMSPACDRLGNRDGMMGEGVIMKLLKRLKRYPIFHTCTDGQKNGNS
jgi:hypothetical protein